MLWLLLACSMPSPRPEAPARAARVVDCGGAGAYTTIQAAVADAVDGDTIEVAPCTYYGPLDFSGKTITIRGTGGSAVTILRSAPGGPAVYAGRAEGPGTTLEGFTVDGGGSADEPAIEEQFASLTLRDVVVTNTTARVTLYARSAFLVLDRVTVDGTNTATEGMIVHGRRGEVVVKDSTFTCGAIGLGYGMEHGAAFVEGSTFHCPGATAVWVFHSQGRVQRAVIEGVLVAENESSDDEKTVVEGSLLLGGARAEAANLQLRNVVVSGQGVVGSRAAVSVAASIVTGAACGLTDSRSSFTVSDTDFWANGANACQGDDPVGTAGNLAVDPLFVDAAAGDYRLQATSPCVDAGPAEASENDPDGTRNDLGGYGGPFSLGGGR